MESLGSNLFKSMGAKVRQLAFNLTDTELKVEEATNGDHWGPHGTAMSEIAQMCFDNAKHKEIMQVLARRLTDTGEEWRHVYKALLLLEFLVKHGPMKVVYEVQGNISFLEELQSFKYKDKNGKDHGLNVRNRAKELTTLVGDQERVLLEREAAQKNKAKYSGISNSDSTFQHRGGFRDESRMTGDGFGVGKKIGMENSWKSGDFPVDEDPFEATRKRIEKLKGSDEVTNKASNGAFGQPISSPRGKKEPKKLSQVKVNPEMAAAFSKIHMKSATNEVDAAVSGQVLDTYLLGGMSNPPTSTSVDLLCDDFTSLNGDLSAPPAPACPSAVDEWSSFEVGTASVQQKSAPEKSEDPFAEMIGASSIPVASANPIDPFAHVIGGPETGLITPSTQTVSNVGTKLPDLFNPEPAPHGLQQSFNTAPGVGFSGGMATGLSINSINALGATTSVMPRAMPQGQPSGNTGFSIECTHVHQPSQGLGLHFIGQTPPAPAGHLDSGPHGNAFSPVGNTIPLSSTAESKSAAGALTPQGPQETVSSHHGTTGPMRPGASRPTPTRAKDPFADLAIL